MRFNWNPEARGYNTFPRGNPCISTSSSSSSTTRRNRNNALFLFLFFFLCVCALSMRTDYSHLIGFTSRRSIAFSLSLCKLCHRAEKNCTSLRAVWLILLEIYLSLSQINAESCAKRAYLPLLRAITAPPKKDFYIVDCWALVKFFFAVNRPDYLSFRASGGSKQKHPIVVVGHITWLLFLLISEDKRRPFRGSWRSSINGKVGPGIYSFSSSSFSPAARQIFFFSPRGITRSQCPRGNALFD